MGIKRIVAALVLADFAVLNLYAFATEGLGGFVEMVSTSGPWGWVVMADLVIALGMVLVWLWADARDRGRNPWGYALVTLLTGSIGTLLYYVTRREPHTQSVGAARPKPAIG